MGGLLLAVLGAVSGAIVWVTREVRDAREHARTSKDALAANLRHEVDQRFRAERDNDDRVYAQRADVSRLEARFDSLESLLREVRDAVVRREV